MDRYSQYSAMILTLLMLSFTLVAHWLACVWYVIADKEKERNDSNWDLGKLHCVLFLITLRLKLSCTIRTRIKLKISAKGRFFISIPL